jgi:hypothetical protein
MNDASPSYRETLAGGRNDLFHRAQGHAAIDFENQRDEAFAVMRPAPAYPDEAGDRPILRALRRGKRKPSHFGNGIERFAREPDVERISHRTPAGKGRTIACPHRGGIIDHGFGKTGPHAVPGSRRQGRAIPCAIRRRKSPTVQTSPSISTSSTGPWASARRPQRSTVTETLMVQPPIAERLAVPPLLPSCK